MQLIGSLTTLTYLELSDTPQWGNAQPLQNLRQLQKLVISNCCGLEVEEELIVPGAFASLVSLHIKGRETSARQNRSDLWTREYHPPGSGLEAEYSELSEYEIQHLSKVGDAILALPNLKELSGCSPILDVLMLHDKLLGWHCKQEGFFGLGRVRYWTKAF